MRVGILGGGQLGRMLALAGYPLGVRFRFLDPNPESPARDVGELVTADYDDSAALDAFIDGLDVVTYEFESIPLAAVESAATRVPVFPPVPALATAQDRVLEKRCFQHSRIPTASSRPVSSRGDLERAAHELGLPAVLKTRRLGYDGKGQIVLRSEEELPAAWDTLGGVPLILEQFVEFDRELSVLAVRSRVGEMAYYPLVENEHEDGVLRRSFAPADASEATTRTAHGYARTLMSSMNYVGVMALEMFESEGRLIANEMAPRVHNSGHWTIEGAETSQFENHIRAVCGYPLGEPASRGCSALVNVLGRAPDLTRVLEVPGAHVHMYGKSARHRRKLGHVTVRGDDAAAVCRSADTIVRLLAADQVT